MGLTWGVAGVATPLVGWISDYTGSLAYAIVLTAVLPIPAAVIAWAAPVARLQKSSPMDVPSDDDCTRHS
jgi:hypothetical protein